MNQWGWFELGRLEKLSGGHHHHVGWLACTWLFPPEKDDVLRSFAKTGVSGGVALKSTIIRLPHPCTRIASSISRLHRCIGVDGHGLSVVGHVNQALSFGGLGIVSAVGVFLIHRRTT